MRNVGVWYLAANIRKTFGLTRPPPDKIATKSAEIAVLPAVRGRCGAERPGLGPGTGAKSEARPLLVRAAAGLTHSIPDLHIIYRVSAQCVGRLRYGIRRLHTLYIRHRAARWAAAQPPSGSVGHDEATCQASAGRDDRQHVGTGLQSAEVDHFLVGLLHTAEAALHHRAAVE